MTDITLYALDRGLVELLDYRAERVADKESPVEDEELEAIDGQIREYLQALPAKIDGVAAILLFKQRRIDSLNAEKLRIKQAINAESSDLASLKSYVADVLEKQEAPRKGPKKLVGSTHTLTLAGNSGVQPLEITDVEQIPPEYGRWVGWISDDAYLAMARAKISRAEPNCKLKWEVSNELVRAALEQPCKQCAGSGEQYPPSNYDGSPNPPESCDGCGGTGQQGIIGCRLMPRGAHVKVS